MPINPKKLNGHTKFDQKFHRPLLSLSAPEIVIFNEPIDLRHCMINSIGDRVKTGEMFEPGKGYADIIGNFDLQFRPMHPSHYWGWLNCACWFYDDNPNTFSVLQCFYPDMKGNFPGSPVANNGPRPAANARSAQSGRHRKELITAFAETHRFARGSKVSKRQNY
jgi:uncharacterized protein DUF4262